MPDQTEVPVVYLDNAPYFWAKSVHEWLRQHPKIIVEFLPSYSPNLNLIERLWRFVKRQLVGNRYYKEYKVFRANVFKLLNHLSDFEDQLKSLINDKFQILGQILCHTKP